MTYTLNTTEFLQIFGVHGRQYKAWYKAVRDLQDKLQKNKDANESGILGFGAIFYIIWPNLARFWTNFGLF